MPCQEGPDHATPRSFDFQVPSRCPTRPRPVISHWPIARAWSLTARGRSFQRPWRKNFHLPGESCLNGATYDNTHARGWSANAAHIQTYTHAEEIPRGKR